MYVYGSLSKYLDAVGSFPFFFLFAILYSLSSVQSITFFQTESENQQQQQQQQQLLPLSLSCVCFFLLFSASYYFEICVFMFRYVAIWFLCCCKAKIIERVSILPATCSGFPLDFGIYLYRLCNPHLQSFWKRSKNMSAFSKIGIFLFEFCSEMELSFGLCWSVMTALSRRKFRWLHSP